MRDSKKAKTKMRIVLLNGPWEFSDQRVREAYVLAEAAVRAKHPYCYIFNPCEYFLKLKKGTLKDFIQKRKKMKDMLRAGAFTEIVLMDDWWQWHSAITNIYALSEGYREEIPWRQKPNVWQLTYEDIEDGQWYLQKMEEYRHQDMKSK